MIYIEETINKIVRLLWIMFFLVTATFAMVVVMFVRSLP